MDAFAATCKLALIVFFMGECLWWMGKVRYHEIHETWWDIPLNIFVTDLQRLRCLRRWWHVQKADYEEQKRIAALDRMWR